MNNLMSPTQFFIVSFLFFGRLTAMEQALSSPAEIFIATEHKLGFSPKTSLKSFTARVHLKTSSKQKTTITEAGHVDYFIYPSQKECYVSWLTILPSLRRQGLGTQLMLEIIKHAQEEQCSHIRLLARANHESPISFYERLGFIITKDDDYECKTLELRLNQEK